MKLNERPDAIFSSRQTFDRDNRCHINDMTFRKEETALYAMTKKLNATRTFEAGLAQSISVFCQTYRDRSMNDPIRYAVDANQFMAYNGAAVTAIQEAGYSTGLIILKTKKDFESNYNFFKNS